MEAKLTESWTTAPFASGCVSRSFSPEPASADFLFDALYTEAKLGEVSVCTS